MSPKIQRLYDAAINDAEFNDQMLNADPLDKRPGFFSGELEQHLYASIYYGWLLRGHKNNNNV